MPAAEPAPSKPAGTTDAAAATADAASTATNASAGTDSSSSLGSVLRIAGLVLLGLLVIVVILRRRAVKRRRAQRIERIRAHREARRRGMIDVLDGDDGSDIRVLPSRTGHHVAAAGRRRVSDRRVVRATRPRDHRSGKDRGRR